MCSSARLFLMTITRILNRNIIKSNIKRGVSPRQPHTRNNIGENEEAMKSEACRSQELRFDNDAQRLSPVMFYNSSLC